MLLIPLLFTDYLLQGKIRLYKNYKRFTNKKKKKSIVVASKLTSDVFYSNKRYAKVIITIDSFFQKKGTHSCHRLVDYRCMK